MQTTLSRDKGEKAVPDRRRDWPKVTQLLNSTAGMKTQGVSLLYLCSSHYIPIEPPRSRRDGYYYTWLGGGAFTSVSRSFREMLVQAAFLSVLGRAALPARGCLVVC